MRSNPKQLSMLMPTLSPIFRLHPIMVFSFTVINLETAQSTLQTQLAQAKTSEQTASLTISSLTSDFSREKAAWARDVEDLERERKDRVRMEGELRKMEDEVRRIRSEGRDREEETRRDVEREKRKVRELEEEVSEERRGREREREEKDAVKVCEATGR